MPNLILEHLLELWLQELLRSENCLPGCGIYVPRLPMRFRIGFRLMSFFLVERGVSTVSEEMVIGLLLGWSDGMLLGIYVGKLLGSSDGNSEGDKLGSLDGTDDGLRSPIYSSKGLNLISFFFVGFGVGKVVG
jgi:hypothetical protein